MIGSTANIVALGMLEKHGGSQITFFQWLKIGLLCTALSGMIAVVALLLMAPFMPDHKITFDKLHANSGYTPAGAEFSGELTGTVEKVLHKYYLLGKVKNETARIQIELPDDIKIDTGERFRLSGVLVKDPANAKYPYMMKVKKAEEIQIKD